MDNSSVTGSVDVAEMFMGNINFRPLGREDLEQVFGWLCQPHVSEWWGPAPSTPGEVEAVYGPCIDGTDPTLMFVIAVANRPVGIIQTYLLADNPEYRDAVKVTDAAGVDLFIGDPTLVDRGLGTEIVRTFLEDVGWPTYPSVNRYMAGPSVRNLRSRRMFEKAGFRLLHQVDVLDEPDREAVYVIERPYPPS